MSREKQEVDDLLPEEIDLVRNEEVGELVPDPLRLRCTGPKRIRQMMARRGAPVALPQLLPFRPVKASTRCGVIGGLCGVCQSARTAGARPL